MQDDVSLLPPKKRHQNPNKKIFSHVFWGTIIALLCITISLSVTLLVRANQQNAKLPSTVEAPQSILGDIIREAAKKAGETAKLDVEQMLNQVYAPVYGAIPDYADFHYSVRGEYTEFAGAILDQLADGIHNRLYRGFDQRLKNAAPHIDQKYITAFNAALAEQVSEKIELLPNQSLGPASTTILEDAKARIKITVPLATVAAVTTGAGAAKMVSATVAKKIAAKIALKAAAKGGAKLGTIGAAAATGATVCLWSGPFAAACALVAGGVAWLTVDAVIVSLDEYINRDDFEVELRGMIDEDRKEKKKQLEGALIQKACAMAEKFTLRTVTDENPLPRSCQLES